MVRRAGPWRERWQQGYLAMTATENQSLMKVYEGGRSPDGVVVRVTVNGTPLDPAVRRAAVQSDRVRMDV
jgi:hypothetical protein